MFTKELDRLGNLLFLGISRTAKHNTACVFYLVSEKFAKVLHIHFALIDVRNRGESAENSVFRIDSLNSPDNIAELSDTRRLDEYSVGVKFGQNLFECLAEIAHERATDTARIHLGHFDSGVTHETAVNAYLAELVFDEDELFARIRFFYHFLNKSCFSRTEKSRKNVYLRHNLSPINL